MGGIRSKLGAPTSNEKTLPDGQGRANSFEHGSIYWSPPSGAHPIWGRIGDKWADKKWESGFLGYPTTDEDLNPDNRGFRQVFQGGSIYYSPQTDAHSIGGSIREKWGKTGWEGGPLGYPSSDEVEVRDGGRLNHFTGGSIYWTSAHGAHPIWGMIRDRWFNGGAENSSWGFPTSDEYDLEDGGKGQAFERYWIDWFPNKDYDGAKAAAYADAWTVNGQTKRNPKYPTGSDDCTFFASQVLREGGLALAGSKNPLDRKERNQWWYVPDTLGGFFQTYSWGGAQQLHDYLVDTNVDGHNIAKQTRVISTNAEKAQPYLPGGAMPGDMLFFDFGHDDVGIDHTMVVAGEDTPYNLDKTNLPKIDYSRTTVIDQHSNDRHHTFWSGNPSDKDWLQEKIYVVHPFGKSDHPWSETEDGQQ